MIAKILSKLFSLTRLSMYDFLAYFHVVKDPGSRDSAALLQFVVPTGVNPRQGLGDRAVREVRSVDLETAYAFIHL